MRNWKNVILNDANTMLDAIEVLNKEALRIVLIVDEERKLIGTVTDGDIRRALIKHKEITKDTRFLIIEKNLFKVIGLCLYNTIHFYFLLIYQYSSNIDNINRLNYKKIRIQTWRMRLA